jgi:hypothetical protein
LFSFLDEPGEHDPCYIVMPGGSCLPVNHHATPGVDIARAKFIIAACNAALTSSLAAQPAPAVDREAIAKIVYEAQPFEPMPDLPRKPAWNEHVNSHMQDAARKAADAILAMLPRAQPSSDEGGR